MNISTLKNILSRKFKGASIDDVQGVSNYSIFQEGASNLLSMIDPFETVRHSEVNLFSDIDDYSAPSDLKGKKILDVRPQVNRTNTNFSQTFTEDFDRDKEDQKFSVEYDEGTKFIRVRKSLSNSQAVDEVTATTNWTAGTGVSNIAVDTILYSEGGGSLRFDIDSGTSYLEWAGTSTDLSTHQEKSSLFRWIYIPDSSIITSVALRIGSSSSAYWTITGSIHFGSIRNGWNLYRFDWNGATQTGTVDETAIDYERLTFVTTSADTDIRIGRLFSKLPYPYEFVYYSEFLFRSTGGTWLETPTADTDIINLDKEAEPLFINECSLLIAEDMQREEEAQKYRNRLYGNGQQVGDYSRYKTDKPSEAIRPQTRYYKVRSTRRGL